MLLLSMEKSITPVRGPFENCALTSDPHLQVIKVMKKTRKKMG